MRRPLKKQRTLEPDMKFNSVKISKLINYIMEEGKKNVARKIVYDAFDYIHKSEKKDPQVVFEEAINNVGPMIELRSRRIGGANYQIPTEVSDHRRLVLALRWIITAADDKKGSAMYKRLGDEIIVAAKNEGSAVTKRENVQKMADANRAFAHLSN